MATHEDEMKVLKEKNIELVQQIQFWKMTAAERENDKVNLMKENNELRLKLSRLRSNGNVQASNLDAALQSASEKALAHLVKASGEIARTMDLAKAYMRDRQDLDTASPRWNSVGGTPASVKKDKIHRVPPLMMGGQSIQPVVALTMLNTSNPRTATRTPNLNRNVTERAVPMHMLQDVYIPLTRIDARGTQAQNMEPANNGASNADNSTEDLGLADDDEERVIDESQQMSDDEDIDSTRRLDAVVEELEPEDEEVTPPRSRTDNPLEGPSWMLDATSSDQGSPSKSRINLEPDSTTELGGSLDHPEPIITVAKRENNTELTPGRSPCEFSPTVRRRRKRSSPPPPPAAPRLTPHCSPRPPTTRRISNNGRVLKVVVAKMRLDGEEDAASPAKRAAHARAHFDAPSPNGATVAGVIVSEAVQDPESLASGEPSPLGRRLQRCKTERRLDSASSLARQDDSRHCDMSLSRQDDTRCTSRRERSRDSRDSDSGSGGDAAEGRTRRPRRVVTYKEKPLNRKMRR